MTSRTPKAAIEIQGFEYDWLGCDDGGCVALFSTAGAGYAPKAFLRDTDAHHIAIDAVLALTATTEASFAPDLDPSCINTWRLVAERGLYAYDSDPNGGPYHLVAAPAVPVRLNELPPNVAYVATAVRCTVRFESTSIVTDELLTE